MNEIFDKSAEDYEWGTGSGSSTPKNNIKAFCCVCVCVNRVELWPKARLGWKLRQQEDSLPGGSVGWSAPWSGQLHRRYSWSMYDCLSSTHSLAP